LLPAVTGLFVGVGNPWLPDFEEWAAQWALGCRVQDYL
jgi:hypothetical protein